MSRIKLVGFEIEGGWSGSKYLSPLPSGTLIADNSINGQSLGNASAISATHVGEAVSPPIPFEGPWRKWLEDSWPNAKPPNRTNRTCGFHIHTSVYSLKDYSLLTGKSFLFGLRDRMAALGQTLKLPTNHVFWERMEGFNTFCQFNFSAGKQLKLVKGAHHGNRARYGYLNFSYNVHGTVEFRALPTFRDAHVAIRFAEEYFDYIEAYLEEVKNVQVEYSTKLVG